MATPICSDSPTQDLKQQVETQRSGDCEESMLRAHVRKNKHPIPRGSRASSIQCDRSNHTVCGVQVNGSRTRTSPAQFCGEGLSARPALFLSAQVPRLLGQMGFARGSQSVSVALIDQGSRNLGSQVSLFSTIS